MKNFLAILTIFVTLLSVGCGGNDKPKTEPKVKIKIENKKITIPQEHLVVFKELDLETVSMANNPDTSQKVFFNALDDRKVLNYTINHNFGQAEVYLSDDNTINRIEATMDGLEGKKTLLNTKENKKVSFKEAYGDFIKNRIQTATSINNTTVTNLQPPKNIPAPYNITRRAVNFLKQNYNVTEVIQQDDAKYVASNDVGHHYTSMVKVRLKDGVKVAAVNIHFTPDGTKYTCDARLRNPRPDGT
ncbi:MAG: hypothetical protein Q4D21_06220 [Phascolarctobacterium sp.]|nr:hypothetical protein [Phascolarctobacterium sp.]